MQPAEERMNESYIDGKRTSVGGKMTISRSTLPADTISRRLDTRRTPSIVKQAYRSRVSCRAMAKTPEPSSGSFLPAV